ncbi:MAG: heme ABC transporter ATP-binding protein [Meiothermus sp.]|nr:heme ABC transporter ATP-binding protein [Meiothermus sp.]
MSLEARDLNLNLGGRTVLRKVSLDVRPGEVLALLGPNGAGKTSLLRALAGDFGGKGVWLEGRPLAGFSVLQQAQRRAVLPQFSRLEFPFTALEVALLGRNPHIQLSENPHDLEIARAALNKTEALHLAERLFPDLSGGERQRVMLARVLAQVWESLSGGNRYLLLDEPTASLDPAHQHHTLGLARTLAAEGLGVLAVLHDLNLAATYADRIALLHQGRLWVTGTPRQVLQPQTIWEVFRLEVEVHPHPAHPGPLVVPLPSRGVGR